MMRPFQLQHAGVHWWSLASTPPPSPASATPQSPPLTTWL
jgi:hypothetical protein